METKEKLLSYTDDGEEFGSYDEMGDSDKIHRFREKIARHIADDNKDELLQLLRCNCGKVLLELDKPKMDLSTFILSQCIGSNAINCTKAFLEGDTGLTPPAFNENGFYPLHVAAGVLSPKMTKYFLKVGVPANAEVANEGTAVDVAVRAIRRRIFWKGGQSYYRLLVKLTGEGMYYPLETLIFLLQKLSDSESSEVICRYAIEGKTIEVATLLLGLSVTCLGNFYMPSDDISSQDRLTLRQCVVNQIVMLENELSKLLPVDRTKLAQCSKMKTSMMSILMLLEIFSRAQHGFAGLVLQLKHFIPKPSIPDAISRVLEDSGFKLTSKDAARLREPLDLQRRREWLRMTTKRLKHPDELPEVKHDILSALSSPGSFATVADIGWDETDSNHEKLRRALEQLSSGIKTSYWTANQSIFKLIVVLCLPEMKQKLEAIRLFAQNIEKVNEIACCYAMEGKLIQLAIILMVAWEKVRDPFNVQIKHDRSVSMTFQQFINSELAQAVDLEYRLIGRITEQEKELSKLCKQRKGAIMSALPLVEVFEKADALRSYLLSERNNKEVVKDVKELLGEAGFKLKSKDIGIGDIVKSSSETALEQLDGAMLDLTKNAEMMTKSGSQKQDFTRLAYVLPCGFIERYGAYGRPNVMKNFLLARYRNECFPPSAAQFRALWSSKAYSTSSPKPLDVGLHKDVARVNWFMQKFLVSKQLASVALAVKRGLKYA